MKYWLAAARLRTLPLSLSGIFLGAFLAKWEGFFNWKIFALSCITTVLYQVLSNFANDYGDGIKGTDKERTGEMRMVASGAISPSKMRIGIAVMVVLSLVSTIALLWLSFRPFHLFKDYFFMFMGLGMACILAAMLYTMGKKPYGYLGLGDIFVFVFFGLVSVCGSYFLYIKDFTWNILVPASAVGFFSVAVLNLNNMRDMETDRKNGKKTLALRLGPAKAKIYQSILMGLPFILATIFIMMQGERFKIATDNNVWQSFKPLFFLVLYIPVNALKRDIQKEKELSNLDKYMKPTALLALMFAIAFGYSLMWGLTK